MRYRNLITLCSASLLLWCGATSAENSVVVESKTVAIGATGVTVGVYVTNDLPLAGIVIPLEFRSLDPGAYLCTSLEATVQNRLTAWEGSNGFGVSQFYSEKVRAGHPLVCPADDNGEAWWIPADSTVDFISPDAYLYAYAGLSSLDAGDDGAPGTGTPSIVLTFDVTATEGQMEIDTVCMYPYNYLAFGLESGDPVVPSFTKGIITIAAGCACDCHGDPDCDDDHDVIDFIMIRDVAFYGADPIPDPNPMCPYETTDVNCDGVTDVQDLVLMQQVVYMGADPEIVFTNPCP